MYNSDLAAGNFLSASGLEKALGWVSGQVGPVWVPKIPGLTFWDCEHP